MVYILTTCSILVARHRPGGAPSAASRRRRRSGGKAERVTSSSGGCGGSREEWMGCPERSCETRVDKPDVQQLRAQTETNPPDASYARGSTETNPPDASYAIAHGFALPGVGLFFFFGFSFIGFALPGVGFFFFFFGFSFIIAGRFLVFSVGSASITIGH